MSGKYAIGVRNVNELTNPELIELTNKKPRYSMQKRVNSFSIYEMRKIETNLFNAYEARMMLLSKGQPTESEDLKIKYYEPFYVYGRAIK